MTALMALCCIGTGLPTAAWADSTPSTLPAQPAPTPPMSTEPIFVSGPPPGALTLLRAVNSDEGQLVSLAAITEAHTLLRQARSAEARALSAYDRAVEAWDQARLRVDDDEAAKLRAEGHVAFVDDALSQLGMAEYTGVATASAQDLQAQETAEYHAELANVAASTTAGTLDRAQAALAADRVRERADRASANHSLVLVAGSRSHLLVAQAQLNLSSRDVSIAHKWAVQTGSAPLYPTAALLRMEGPLGRALLAEARNQERALAAHGGSGASAPNNGPPTATTVPSPAPGTTVPGVGVGARASAQPGGHPLVPGLNLGVPQDPAVEGPSILGPPLLSEQQILGWFESTGAQAHITTPLAQLVWDYLQAGRLTGVRADIAFAQSIVETGHFEFPPHGQLTSKDNNFAGIGACDTCKKGWHYASAMTGVLAQERLLQAYATPSGSGSDISAMAGGVRGCCTTWLALSGVWASNPNYGYEILGIYKEMLDYAIPRTLLEDGLITQSVFQQDELELPVEDARTYALVAQAIQADSPPPISGSCPPGASSAKAKGGLSGATTSTLAAATTTTSGATSPGGTSGGKASKGTGAGGGTGCASPGGTGTAGSAASTSSTTTAPTTTTVPSAG